MRIGCLSFGGPAGQIALMHREIIEERKWLREEEYLNALNFCMLLPGPEAMQLATYAGWRLHGVMGGLAAGLLFVFPGAVIVFGLAAAYGLIGQVPVIAAAFVGIKAAVLIVVVEALLRVSKRALTRSYDWLIAAAAFTAIFFLSLPYPLIVIAAAAVGYGLAPAGNRGTLGSHNLPGTLAGSARTALIWSGIWIVPVLLLAVTLGAGNVLTVIAVFFSKLAVVTFGGAYAVLAYMAQAAVEDFAWLSAGEMLDGLGLAETTPGPLILVTEFVGYLAAARDTGGHSLTMGLVGAIVTLWVTFVPCFLWIFVGAPYVVQLARAPRLRSALRGITAAVVGVILSLSLWFGLHVLAPGIEERWIGPIRYWRLPETGLDWLAMALAFFAAVLLLVLHQGILRAIGACALLAIIAQFLFDGWSMG